MPTEPPASLPPKEMPPVDLARVDAILRSQDGRVGDLGESGRNFARIINRLQRVVRMVQASEEKVFKRTLQRWRLIDAPYALELGTERRGAGQFALIARWAADAAPDNSAFGAAQAIVDEKLLKG
ncbi:MAG TPA: hypothetical protein VIU62_09085 [Chloroflexota bacterium]